MRKNTQEAFKAWIAGQSCRKNKSVWTTGGVVYSYNTPIAKFSDVSDTQAIVNMQCYSNTTTVHQRGLLTLMGQHGIVSVACPDEDSFKATDRV